MDTREVVARFEAERQALALHGPSEHRPVFDGGSDLGAAVLRDGVRAGEPITEYCDRQRLSLRRTAATCSSRSARRSSTRTRKASFTATSSRRTFWCAANGVPVPKVIDFGIAKATTTSC